MTKKSKSTKQIRAIDRIIKFQLDDGIESLTISGKDVLADVSIDRKANVTLFLNADPDKINEIQSLIPFVTVKTATGGTETDKTKTVTLSQDLTQFALEIDDNSKELATLIKSQSSIVLDLNGLVQQLLEIAGKLAKLEQKNKEQDNRLTAIEEKDKEQDNKLATIETEQAEHAGRLTNLEQNTNSTDFNTKIIKTVQPFYEEADMYTDDIFLETKNMKCNIGTNRSIRDGIIFINIQRYLGEEFDGNAIITAMFKKYIVSDSNLVQEHIVEFKSISSGNIKLHCNLLNQGLQQEFKIYGIPKDSNENYKIKIEGFKFEDVTVLTKENEPMFI